MRAPLPSEHDPGIPARQLDGMLVQYVQGTGNPWGTMEIIGASKPSHRTAWAS